MMNDEIYRKIQQIVPGDVRFEEPLCNHTSMGVGGPGDVLAFPNSLEETGQLISFLTQCGIPAFPVGNWTNIIVRDGGYRGIVVSLKKMRTVRLLENLAGGPGVYAHGGANLSDLVSLSVEEGLMGLEFCAGIPGSVGGAVKMNAGAYGREMKDVIYSVLLMDRSGSVREYDREHLTFCYRRLAIPEGSVILAATYRLSAGNKVNIKEKIKEIMAKRREKHPLEYKSAGSIFKNPKEKPAGQIIEELGLKGIQVGGAKISEKHGNFIVNVGNAKAKDITTLIKMIQEIVLAQRGIYLEPEVMIVGEET
jgi:UDP-N-acetylmuramate dehydrogenase